MKRVRQWRIDTGTPTPGRRGGQQVPQSATRCSMHGQAACVQGIMHGGHAQEECHRRKGSKGESEGGGHGRGEAQEEGPAGSGGAAQKGSRDLYACPSLNQMDLVTRHSRSSCSFRLRRHQGHDQQHLVSLTSLKRSGEITCEVRPTLLLPDSSMWRPCA